MYRYTPKGSAKGEGKCDAIVGPRGGLCQNSASRVIHLGKPHADGSTHSFVVCEKCFTKLKRRDKTMKPWPYRKNDDIW